MLAALYSQATDCNNISTQRFSLDLLALICRTVDSANAVIDRAALHRHASAAALSTPAALAFSASTSASAAKAASAASAASASAASAPYIELVDLLRSNSSIDIQTNALVLVNAILSVAPSSSASSSSSLSLSPSEGGASTNNSGSAAAITDERALRFGRFEALACKEAVAKLTYENQDVMHASPLLRDEIEHFWQLFDAFSPLLGALSEAGTCARVGLMRGVQIIATNQSTNASIIMFLTPHSQEI